MSLRGWGYMVAAQKGAWMVGLGPLRAIEHMFGVQWWSNLNNQNEAASLMQEIFPNYSFFLPFFYFYFLFRG